MDDISPALACTSTLWPASTSSFTPEGTMPTRDSRSLTSLGTPMIMRMLGGIRVPPNLAQVDCGEVALLRTINLRALQPVRVVHVHGFPLGVKIDCTNAALAVSVPRGLHPSEGQVHLGADGGRIDVSDARMQVAHRGERLVHVARVDGRRQAVLNAIGDR